MIDFEGSGSEKQFVGFQIKETKKVFFVQPGTDTNRTCGFTGMKGSVSTYYLAKKNNNCAILFIYFWLGAKASLLHESKQHFSSPPFFSQPLKVAQRLEAMAVQYLLRQDESHIL